MLISVHQPDAARRSRGDATQVRRIKDWVRTAFAADEDSVISVNELRCAEPSCPDVETVIGIFSAGQPTRRLRLLKPLAAVTADDLVALSRSSLEP